MTPTSRDLLLVTQAREALLRMTDELVEPGTTRIVLMDDFLPDVLTRICSEWSEFLERHDQSWIPWIASRVRKYLDGKQPSEGAPQRNELKGFDDMEVAAFYVALVDYVQKINEED